MFRYPSIPFLLILAVFLNCFSIQSEGQTLNASYHTKGKDSLSREMMQSLQKSFLTKEEAQEYISILPQRVAMLGYPGASVDSVAYDSTTVNIFLFLGAKYLWRLNIDSVPDDVLAALRLNRGRMATRNFLYPEMKQLENDILDYYENKGHPFAKITFDETTFDSGLIHSSLKIVPGSPYPVDSIRVFGKAKIRNRFLQHYLGIFDGDLYNKSVLSQIDKRLADLPYLQQTYPWDMMMLGSGVTLNLYLEPRRSSEVNALIGFLPGNSETGTKTKITADVRLNLKNALGVGENILLNWQQLQPQTPRLDLGYSQPYLFNSPYGVDFAFGMLKQDSSWLRVEGKLGAEYFRSANTSFSVFYRVQNSYLLQGGLDTNRVIRTHQLPAHIDVRSGSGGIAFRTNNTDYRLNPRRGTEGLISFEAGIRKVKKSNEILELSDPFDPDFDFNSLYDTVKLKSYVTTLMGSFAQYLPVGNTSVLKLAANLGWIQSPQIFRNEMYRIGGYKLLRGFDEESIYADRYGVFTAEYRYLTGRNSFLFGFADLGFSHANFDGAKRSGSFQSLGIGIELETKVGMLNLSYAVGRRNDIKFDLRSASKIHFGYVNYF
ncbi:MAG: hypothetical protein J5I50_00240 [Chitinophagaceae bacterium]|nr:hypothetical protein [Chitinophagaceae bacterium]